MKRYVIDTNTLSSKEISAYLDASKHNFGVITEATMIELHKRKAADVVRDVLRLPCLYPRQIILLRDEFSLIEMDGSTKRLVRNLIDEAQTKGFPNYCSTIIGAPFDDSIAAYFAKIEKQSSEYMERFTTQSVKIFNLFKAEEHQFDEDDVRNLRKRQSYPIGLQKKLIDMAFAVRALLIRNDQDSVLFQPKPA